MLGCEYSSEKRTSPQLFPSGKKSSGQKNQWKILQKFVTTLQLLHLSSAIIFVDEEKNFWRWTLKNARQEKYPIATGMLLVWLCQFHPHYPNKTCLKWWKSSSWSEKRVHVTSPLDWVTRCKKNQMSSRKTWYASWNPVAQPGVSNGVGSFSWNPGSQRDTQQHR